VNKPKQSQSEGRAEELAGHEPVSFDPGQPEHPGRGADSTCPSGIDESY